MLIIKYLKIIKIKLIKIPVVEQCTAPCPMYLPTLIIFKTSKRSMIMKALMRWILCLLCSTHESFHYFFHTHSTFLCKTNIVWHDFVLYFSILWKKMHQPSTAPNLARYHHFSKFMFSNTMHWLLSAFLQA